MQPLKQPQPEIVQIYVIMGGLAALFVPLSPKGTGQKKDMKVQKIGKNLDKRGRNETKRDMKIPKMQKILIFYNFNYILKSFFS